MLLKSLLFQNTTDPSSPPKYIYVLIDTYVHVYTRTCTHTLLRAKKKPHRAWATEAGWLGENPAWMLSTWAVSVHYLTALCFGFPHL